MKKLLGILVLAFLFSGNANAGVNEPGSGPITSILEIKRIHKEHLPKACLLYTSPSPRDRG